MRRNSVVAVVVSLAMTAGALAVVGARVSGLLGGAQSARAAGPVVSPEPGRVLGVGGLPVPAGVVGRVELAEPAVPLPVPSVVLPEAGVDRVDVARAGPQRAARAPVSIDAGGAAAKDRGLVDVEVVAGGVRDRLGFEGLAFRLRPVAAAVSTPAVVSVDYSKFADLFGGDWASRLRFMRMPECALTTPELEPCQRGEVVASSNDVKGGVLSARLDLARFGPQPVSEVIGGVSPVPGRSGTAVTAMLPGDGGVYGLSSGTNSLAGNFAASSMALTSKWQVGLGTGDFGWSYPLPLPGGPGGPSPSLALSYNSGAVDSMTAATNNQGSWVGAGWNLDSGYVERRYRACNSAAPGTTAPSTWEDLCWVNDNAFLVLNGHSSELVPLTGSTGEYRLRDDPGWRVQRLVGAPGSSGFNKDNDGEYWVATTPDGVKYTFGWGKEKNTPYDTNSVWTVPVAGLSPGQPCYNASNSLSSWCQQAWRWNVDRIEDSSGAVSML